MNEQRKIVEDSPTMRSVALLSPPMMPSMRPLTPLKIPFSAVEQESKLWYNNTPEKSSSPHHHEVTCFPAFPTEYFLERTHVRIQDATPEQVFARVSAILSQESIATNYDANEVTMECESEDHVEFMIRFFQTEDACILVETQRLCGCSFSFHQLAKCVLRSAKGLAATTVAKPLPLPPCIPRSSEQERTSCMKEGLDIAVSLMQQESLDAQLMALESLAQLSRTVFAAESILGNHEILHFVLSFVSRGNADDDDTMQHSSSNASKMHRAAMTVVANCLDALYQNDTLERSLQACGVLSDDHLLSSLLSQVSDPTKPHEACHAIRVLQVLALASNDTKQRLQAHSAPVFAARTIEHRRLGELSQQLLKTWEH